MEYAEIHLEIEAWQNMRGTETNTRLRHREAYLVVLAERQGYGLWKTAYCTERSSRIVRMQRDRDATRVSVPSISRGVK